MENSTVVHKEPEYKAEFYQDLDKQYSDLRGEFWRPLNDDYKEPFYETPAQRKAEKKEKNKVVKSHDIWKKETYDTGEWKDHKYKSVYKKDYHNKFGESLTFNPEMKEKEDNMRRTQISEYSNALHNKCVR